MNGTTLSRVTGIALILIGSLAMIGWYAHIPLLISIGVGETNIVFNSALSFFLMGMTLLCADLKNPMQQIIFLTTGILVALMATMTLCENIFNYSLGIDQLFIEPWLRDQNPSPGRMADNSSLVFLFSGLALVMLPNSAKKAIAELVKICIFSTLILGFSALSGYLLGLKVLSSWNLYSQMSLISAIGNSILGLGLWSLWHQKEYSSDHAMLPGEEGKRAISIGLTIFFCTMMLSSFAVLKMLSPIAQGYMYLAEIKHTILVALIIGMGILFWQLVPLIQLVLTTQKKLIQANSLLQESEMKYRSAFDDAAKTEEQLRHLAYHDSLTGLLNRNSLEQKMREILSDAQHHDRGFALIFLDLDRFKNINDTIGHDAGDLLLQIIGQRLKTKVRGTDVVARIGGDEFVLILNGLNQVDKISNFIQKIISQIAQAIALKGHEIFITTSIGISVYPYDGTDVATLMKNADLALYRAKELGRNNYQFCTLEMTTKAYEKMSRQNAIIHAMAKNEFLLHFQPKLHLSDQSISGVEALLRWHNPEYSDINALEIIHLAEETGLIIALNEWVFKTACLQVREWHQAGFSTLNLSVNLSGKQFKQAQFVENLIKQLDETEFPAENLELEITEELIMQDPEYILHTLHLLKQKGISISIDNFGTGYSSLEYLRRFSVDKIKIDRKFIQRLMVDEASTTLVSAIMAMANKLGVKTVAEGVETQEQYDFLLKEKCTEIQGFYISPPGNVETISRFLKESKIQSYMRLNAKE